MLEKSLRKLGTFQEKHPFIVLGLVLLLTLTIGYYSVRLETDSSFDRMYSDETQHIILKDLVSNEFGSTDQLFVLLAVNPGSADQQGVKDIRDPEVINAAHQLAKSLRLEPAVDEVATLADVFFFYHGSIPDTLEESKEILNAIDFDSSLLVSDDFTMQIMVIDVNIEPKPGSLEVIEEALEKRIDEAVTPAGVTMTLTGEPSLISRIMNLLINDNLRTVLVALIGVFIVMLIYFRSIPVALVAVIPVMISIILLTGTLTLLDIRITMMIASVGAMMVGMGIDYSIHMTHAFTEEVKAGRKKAGRRVVTSVGGALFASALTTVAGFAAMMLGSTPNSITQGKVLAIAIGYSFFVTLVALPAMLVIQQKYMYSTLDRIIFRIRGQQKHGAQWGTKLLAKLAGFQVKRPWLILIGSLVFTFLMFPGFGLVYLDTDNANWIPDGDPVEQSLEAVSLNFGGITFQNFLIQLDDTYAPDEGEDPIVDLRDPRVLHQLALVSDSVQGLEFVNGVDSPVSVIRSLNNDKVPNSLEEVKNVLERQVIPAEHYNEDFSLLKFSVRADDMETDEYYEILNEVTSIPFPAEVKVFPQGGEASFIELDQELGRDTAKTTLIGFVLVIIIATLLYRSFVVGLLAFFPIVFALLWTVGLMGYIGLPFTVLTSGMLAILMGMGIDFSIHIIHRAREKIEEGLSIKDSITGAMTSTGEAISVATVTTIIGFLALSFASLLGTQRLGWTLAVGVLCTFFSCMIIVPAALTVQFRLKSKVRKDE